MQIKRRIFKCLLCKLVVYSLEHSETFDLLHVFLPLTITELSTLKQVRFFLANPVFTKNVSGNHIYITGAPICIYDPWYHIAFLT